MGSSEVQRLFSSFLLSNCRIKATQVNPHELGMVVHNCQPSIQEAQGERKTTSSRQPELHNKLNPGLKHKTPSQKNKRNKYILHETLKFQGIFLEVSLLLCSVTQGKGNSWQEAELSKIYPQVGMTEAYLLYEKLRNKLERECQDPIYKLWFPTTHVISISKRNKAYTWYAC